MMLIREHLSLVFHRYLSGEQGLKKLDIRMNELSIDPHDPFLSKKSTQLMDEETIIVRGSKVKVKPYILPHVSKLTQKELKARQQRQIPTVCRVCIAAKDGQCTARENPDAVRKLQAHVRFPRGREMCGYCRTGRICRRTAARS